MKISESWLREWVNPDLDSAALAHRLTMLGLEVDRVEAAAEGMDNIVVGEVLDVTAHPNADRLSLCRVDVGQAKPLAIVCGAANVRAGTRYPTALVGARLPGGLEISRSKIRGEISEGMLCSAVELKLAESADGILELDDSAGIGVPISDALGLDDHTIDIDLTPNRADCFSVLGVARDLAAGQRLEFDEPDGPDVGATIDEVFPVQLEDRAGCGRFVGRVIRNISATAETPLWMRERLRRSGIRPIQLIVDVTNFVMLELGQPLHAYDLEKLSGGIRVRRGLSDERVVLLGGQEVTVDPEVLVIADEGGAIAMAGIMGGEATAVSDATEHVYLESAFFVPEVIAGRARRFGMHTDASVRFERGVDPTHQARAVQRATELLLEIAGGDPGPLSEANSEDQLPTPEPIRLRTARLSAVLGIEIPAAEVEAILCGLKMEVQPKKDGWLVTPPSARFDINIEADLIEEVVRLYGYDRIPEIPGEFTVVLGSATESRVPMPRIRDALVTRGYREAMTYSFVAPTMDRALSGGLDGVTLSNPISSELGVMRQSLWPGLVQCLRHNLDRQHGRVRLFESGIRFFQQDTDIIEENMLAGLAVGAAEPEQWGRTQNPVDLFDIRADLEVLFELTGAAQEFEFCADESPVLRPGRTARITRAGEKIGWLGELHPALTAQLELAVTPVMFEVSLEPLVAATISKFQGISKFPVVRRDIALVIDRDIPVAELEKTIRESGGPALRDTMIFDVYEGSNIETGSKSVAVGLILQEASRTLTEADVDGIMRAVIDRLSRDFNASIRE